MGGWTIFRLVPYILLIGVLLLTTSGSWIILSYKTIYIYPVLVQQIFAIGLLLVCVGYLTSLHYRVDYKANGENAVKKKQNREFLLKLVEAIKKYENPLTIAGLLVIVVLVVLLLTDAIDGDLFFKIIYFTVFSIALFYTFVKMMLVDETVTEKEKDRDNTNNENSKTAKFLRLVDYRRHPLSISLILFTLVTISYVLFNKYDLTIEVAMSNSMYAMTLPEAAVLLPLSIFGSSFLFISNHFNFFGFQRVRQSSDNVTWVLFCELIIGGVTLFIWLFTVMENVFSF